MHTWKGGAQEHAYDSASRAAVHPLSLNLPSSLKPRCACQSMPPPPSSQLRMPVNDTGANAGR